MRIHHHLKMFAPDGREIDKGIVQNRLDMFI